MGNKIRVKICGLREPGDVAAAVSAGAGYLGFNFVKISPRFVPIKTAQTLMSSVPAGVARVALVVNATNNELDGIVESAGFDMLQLHGAETPDRVIQIRERYGLPVMKALGVRDENDLPALQEYGRVADQLLVDAKPPKNATLPGGNGLAFDWRLVAGRRWPVPWMLAGGLTSENVAEAIRLTGARQVDTASGVETAPGKKGASLIEAFVNAAQVRSKP